MNTNLSFFSYKLRTEHGRFHKIIWHVHTELYKLNFYSSKISWYTSAIISFTLGDMLGIRNSGTIILGILGIVFPDFGLFDLRSSIFYLFNIS